MNGPKRKSVLIRTTPTTQQTTQEITTTQENPQATPQITTPTTTTVNQPVVIIRRRKVGNNTVNNTDIIERLKSLKIKIDDSEYVVNNIIFIEPVSSGRYRALLLLSSTSNVNRLLWYVFITYIKATQEIKTYGRCLIPLPSSLSSLSLSS